MPTNDTSDDDRCRYGCGADEGHGARVCALNDEFRQSFSGGRVLVTRGVAALPAQLQAQVFGRVREFSAFESENDPYGEHDFGNFEIGESRFFWKIDYYDLLFTSASPDPTDPSVTARVLTVMLADEY